MILNSARHINQMFAGRWMGVLCAVLLAAFPPVSTLTAQSNQPPAAAMVSANRFLFIVETSAAVKANAPAVLKVVGDLIYSGANGQMRDGDTFGLWTFNQQVYSTLPVQTWAQSIRAQVADRTAAFLRQQPLEKTAQFDRVLTNMFGLIAASDFITVVIVSTGDEKMKGTPFDAEMNALYKQTIKDMKGQRMPVVTVLQAKGGKLLRYIINALPWPVIIPEVPFQFKPAAPAAPKPAPRVTPVNPPPVTKVPPLILQSSNPPVPAPAPTPKAIVPPLIIQRETPPPVSPPQPAVSPLVSPTPTTAPAPVPAVTTPPVENPRNEVSIPAPAPSPPPIVAAKPITPAVVPATTPIETTKAIVSPLVSPPSAPEPVAAPKLAPAGVPEPSPVAPATPQVSAPEPPLAALTPAPVQHSNILLIASIGLVVIALGLIGLMVLRNRSTAGPSLITQSIVNRKK